MSTLPWLCGGVDIRELFGRNVARLRVERELSQVELAAELKTSSAKISEYETGVTGCVLDTVGRIADVLGVPPAELFNAQAVRNFTRPKPGRPKKTARTRKRL